MHDRFAGRGVDVPHLRRRAHLAKLPVLISPVLRRALRLLRVRCPLHRPGVALLVHLLGETAPLAPFFFLLARSFRQRSSVCLKFFAQFRFRCHGHLRCVDRFLAAFVPVDGFDPIR